MPTLTGPSSTLYSPGQLESVIVVLAVPSLLMVMFSLCDFTVDTRWLKADNCQNLLPAGFPVKSAVKLNQIWLKNVLCISYCILTASFFFFFLLKGYFFTKTMGTVDVFDILIC